MLRVMRESIDAGRERLLMVGERLLMGRREIDAQREKAYGSSDT